MPATRMKMTTRSKQNLLRWWKRQLWHWPTELHMHTLFLSTTVCCGDWDGLSMVFLFCLLASAFCAWKCWRTLATGKALSRQKWKKNKAVSSMVFRTWNAPSEGLIFSFHRLHWHVLTGGNLMPFGSIWPFYHIPSYSIYVEDTAQKMVSFTSYRCFTSYISRLATFPNPRVDEPINSDIKLFRGCGSSSGAWQQGGENNGKHGNMLG